MIELFNAEEYKDYDCLTKYQSTMRKIEIAERLVSKMKFKRFQAMDIVDCVFEAISSALIRGEKVYVREFGTFETTNTKPRMGRNVITGEDVPVPARRKARLRFSNKFQKRINEYEPNL